MLPNLWLLLCPSGVSVDKFEARYCARLLLPGSWQMVKVQETFQVDVSGTRKEKSRVRVLRPQGDT